jgi:hypothetical protein
VEDEALADAPTRVVLRTIEKSIIATTTMPTTWTP